MSAKEGAAEPSEDAARMKAEADAAQAAKRPEEVELGEETEPAEVEAERQRFINWFMSHRFDLYDSILTEDMSESARQHAALALWSGFGGCHDFDF